MRDFRDAKAMAQTLRQALSAKQISVSHSECLEIVSKQFGVDNWNILAARIEGQRGIRPADEHPDELQGPLYCSFCAKSQHEVRKLIAGPDAFICEQCVSLCGIIMDDNDVAALLMEERDSGTPLADLMAGKSTEDLLSLEQRAEELLARCRLNAEIAAAVGQGQDGLEAIPPKRSASHNVSRHERALIALLAEKSPDDRRAYIEKTKDELRSVERVLDLVTATLASRPDSSDPSDQPAE